MTTPCEHSLVEKPIFDLLTGQYGYRYIHPGTHPTVRSRENEVLFKPLLISALRRLNDIDEPTAQAIYNELAAISDNQRWIEVLRGDYSRRVPGEETHRTIRLLDFDHPENNDFAVTNQLRVQAEVVRKPDVVVYVNGIPLVVIEAKSPLNPGQNAFDAIDQIRSAEKDVPRLFASNLFNIATNDVTFLYGATGAQHEEWFRWRDPWPRQANEFADETEKGLYALLEPTRLLDILAHFIVFETRDGKTVKKIARYQQFRAVNKMVLRVVEGRHQQGLIWHTQGSGKSLTMVFAALKLKFHRGVRSGRLHNPNLLVVTDRIDLHDQISKTFEACGLQNPIEADSIIKLRQTVVAGVSGRTVISTIFKFHWDDPLLQSEVHRQRLEALKALEIAGSENWILMVDECHRTQERDLGAFLRAILPKATRFGFTGTPVKKGDHDTYRNFGVQGENYLDKYGIQDAVNDGATVPIYYQGRMTEWHLHDKEIDVVFDQYFADYPTTVVDELKRRGVTREMLARFQPRIDLVALDLWTHYRQHVQPDGFKAQVVAIDRLTCVAYKMTLDKVIAAYFVKARKLSPEEAFQKAGAMSACVYSPGQHDSEQHPDLVKYQVSEEALRSTVLSAFHDRNNPLCFLIVCNKLLTGFDAPIEQAMYLDSPLTDHNLLQAIARTNRRYGGSKQNGLIVDYIGVSKKLVEALAAYNADDVLGAMTDSDALHDQLRATHRTVMDLIKGVPTSTNVKRDFQAAIAHLTAEDSWYIFRSAANAFVKAYAALSPDPRVLPYQADLKFVAGLLQWGDRHFEQKEEIDWRGYSEKIREILDQYLEVTGLKTAFKIRSLADPSFWEDFEAEGKSEEDLKTAAVRKLTELKKETKERADRNPVQYETFSQRVRELIQQFQQGLLEAAEVLSKGKDIALGVKREDDAYEKSGLSKRAYGVWRILEQHRAAAGVVSENKGTYGGESLVNSLQKVATEIDGLYASDDTAPLYWQDKAQLKKELRGQVRRLLQFVGIDGWQREIPQEVEHYAVVHYGKP